MPAAVCILLVLSSLGACDLLPAETDISSEYVVESYQIAGEPLAKVRLMRTLPAETTYSTQEAAVTGAQVEIQRLDADNDIRETYSYSEKGKRSGIYLPDSAGVKIEPLVAYRLRVQPAGSDRVISAVTTIPDTFSIAGSNPDTVQFKGTERFGIRVTRSQFPGRESIYLLNTRALDAREEQLTPVGRELVSGTGSLGGGSPYSVNSLSGNEWPLVREERYTRHNDRTLTVDYPWINFTFYGPHQIDIHVIDDHLYDFIRSDNAQQGRATPGEIPNVIDHIAGGTGLFAGLARASYDVYVTR